MLCQEQDKVVSSHHFYSTHTMTEAIVNAIKENTDFGKNFFVHESYDFYVENPKEWTKKFLEQQDCMIQVNIQKPVSFLYPSNDQAASEIKYTILLNLCMCPHTQPHTVGYESNYLYLR